MLGLGTDDVVQVDALFLQRLGHHVGGLLLAVDLAAVGHGRALERG